MTEPLGQPRWGNAGRDRKAAALHETLRRVCGSDPPRSHWLDVGCGSGGIATALAERGIVVTGVDPEPWPSWADAMAAHPGLRLVQGAFDGEALPVPAESADVVVCNQVYEHDADPARLVANIARVLRPGGRCYFAGPNLLWPVEPHVFWPFVHWLPRRAAQACMRALGSSRAGELDAWSRDWLTLRRWFREHRFERRWVLRERLAAEFDVRGRPRMAAGIARLPSWLFALLEPISPGFIYVLRKPLVPEGHG